MPGLALNSRGGRLGVFVHVAHRLALGDGHQHMLGDQALCLLLIGGPLRFLIDHFLQMLLQGAAQVHVLHLLALLHLHLIFGCELEIRRPFADQVDLHSLRP